MGSIDTGLDLDLTDAYTRIRGITEWLAEPLGAEDQTVQSMPDVSPTKWHRAHVTWFFETFILGPNVPGYRPYDRDFAFLFNSYYEAVGPRHTRAARGLITRPGVGEVMAYRQVIDDAMTGMLAGGVSDEVATLVELGLHHEQQHQELILMDIKHVLAQNPTRVAYRPRAYPPPPGSDAAHELQWIDCEGGLVELGNSGEGFSYDNECPCHRVWLEPFRLADRLVTCGEWKEFMADGGYERPELWLSDGWAMVQQHGWDAPLYWRRDAASTSADDWQRFTLAGPGAVPDAEPVCHVSHYEADAFATWAGARLPTEFEWEHAVVATGSGNDASHRLSWQPAETDSEPNGTVRQWCGDVWQWTASPYVAYPGFCKAAGAVGEYNGKFMSNQMVLRGGACITPEGHTRATYRNFFPPSARWAFGGVRLAANA